MPKLFYTEGVNGFQELGMILQILSRNTGEIGEIGKGDAID